LSARFLGDKARLLIALPAGRPTQIWDTATGQAVFSLNDPSILRCVGISPDRRKFLTGDSNGTARLWSTQDAAPASPPFEHRSPLRVAIIDATGRFVLTVTEDLRASLWNAETAELLSSVSLGRLLSQLGLSNFASTNLHGLKPLAFFAGDGRKAYVLTQQCLLVTLSLIPDSRSATQIAADVAIRSGCELDSAGGLRRLTPEQLATNWDVVDGPQPHQPRNPSQLPANGAAPISQHARDKAPKTSN
jgi:WD40 repeat protein